MDIEEMIRTDLLLQVEMIDKETENVDWESEFGLTCAKMEEVKERMYKRLMRKIEKYERCKKNGSM